ncbi:2-phospho-L-lactate guanylyltransferase [Natrialba magadii ATCC 43099]|uniref:2-phospho-L-lactate guanylyltransferase n=2 Tax=Natrialba magadii (strain ATCC 43099 / DSM 3394 / CCM 3739 / CIP 104546 / IAM 13178 / JCM 8861 / NBRC 102185 / NCIMB 2190 / MS3) TaxID=547559 RepID=COFC_NATMM|nr:2-phospho-L-lactate guanylyltransferase [Natrialba magadii]D3SYZ8.2 RecName: Full=2-phospho-L-lactate guanylyltransferase; Short=LP guanylyltransferase [Natrialba magadii ATCC 43099]ADD06190.2 2-phospho-L-lactate guanylyltransferase [Natrialba magadii ATCC 43099]ELY30811.1 2-phospho-L-lactate guanylyltransferase CofC [Natrialba magadii ATCC 43099]
MHVVVPFAADTPKTRLSEVLSPPERTALARAMLADVLSAITATGHVPTVLSTSPLSLENGCSCDDLPSTTPPGLESASDIPVTVDDRPLTAAVNAQLEAAEEPVAIVMADLALATPAALSTLFASGAADGVAIAPGRGGGTNALVVRHPDFRVDYHGASYLDHREHAAEIGAPLESVDSFRLGTDVDEPADLVEVLIHGRETAADGGESRTATRLRELGFELETTDGRVTVARDRS